MRYLLGDKREKKVSDPGNSAYGESVDGVEMEWRRENNRMGLVSERGRHATYQLFIRTR